MRKPCAQFLAVCSASILAEALRIGSQFSSKSRVKRGVSVSRTRTHLDRLQPTTNSDKLSDNPYARVASIAPSSQMLYLCVSGMTKMAIRNMSNGSPMGYASAHPTLCVDR